MKGYMYILLCADESYYTGSTCELDSRIIEHENGAGANYTKKRLPVKLVYFEEYDRIDDASTVKSKFRNGREGRRKR